MTASLRMVPHSAIRVPALEALESESLDNCRGNSTSLPNGGYGSTTEVSDGHENVRSWGKSRSQFQATGCLLLAISGPKDVGLEV